MQSYTYTPRGVCSRQITFDVEDSKVYNVNFMGGCNGNTQGLSKLCEGMEVDELIKRLSDIDCGGKGTSCPDQLAKALELSKKA